jgi:transcription elongation factor GreA
MNKLPMTVEGFNRLQDELKRLKSTERPAIIRAIAEARTHGDIAENAEYHAARERQSFIEETNEEQTFRIVGEDEADISNGRLSVTSPLARALIGKGKGDSVEVSTPRGNKSYEVVAVAFG